MGGCFKIHRYIGSILVCCMLHGRRRFLKYVMLSKVFALGEQILVIYKFNGILLAVNEDSVAFRNP